MVFNNARKYDANHYDFLLNETLTRAELGQISDRIYMLDQSLGRATIDVRNDHGVSDGLRAIMEELVKKTIVAKAMIYRREPVCMKEAIAELAEAAECACMTVRAEKNARAETIAAVEALPQYIAVLKL